MLRSDTCVGCLDMWNTVLMEQVGEPFLILYSRRAIAVTRHRTPLTASWCTTAFVVPFFVLAIQVVALSDVRRVASGAYGCRSYPSFQSGILHLRRAMVRFCSYGKGAGVVYLTTLSK
jgi:hypothetical protein